MICTSQNVLGLLLEQTQNSIAQNKLICTRLSWQKEKTVKDMLSPFEIGVKTTNVDSTLFKVD